MIKKFKRDVFRLVCPSSLTALFTVKTTEMSIKSKQAAFTVHRSRARILNKSVSFDTCTVVTNLVAIPPHGLLHHTTAAHHSTSDYNSHHSLHLRRTHSQLIALIIHCTDHTAPHHPLYISFGLHLIHCEVLFSPV